ncbi:sensor histidine kinase [Robinsoniella peoriensis]|uniref:sensor histidine kinase n=1 Tax=Robinsoniella peoriensis TaxID=180332 RepID=UPI00085C3849|nr:histidine kinase [Robinsoniella peoriensis]
MKHIAPLLNKFNRIKYKLVLYAGILFLFVFIIAFIANKGNINALNAYSDFSDQYSELGSFYQNMESAAADAQTYLYLRDTEYLKSFENTLKIVHEKLDRLTEYTDSVSLKWRYQLLRNMVDSYSEGFDDLKEQRRSMDDFYGFFSRIPENIQATYIEYSTLLTNEMNLKRDDMIGRLKTSIAITIIIITLMFVITILFAVISICTITRPLGKIVENIKGIKHGNYRLAGINSADNDLKVLCEAIEDMSLSIQKNIEHVKEKSVLEKRILESENENLKIHDLLTETELKVLQGQINPHFLFNTLSLISRMAYLENAPKTKELMEITSDLLRYSLEKSNSTSDLRGEIGCIKNYLEIQKKRFGHRIQFQLFVEEGLPDPIMPGMVIQPLVENAVIHGVADMMEDAAVDVVIYRKHDKICVLVEDNGVGMDSDILEAITSGQLKETGTRANGNNIGFNNVKRRLDVFYGTEGILTIESSKGCGTAISINLPFDEESEELS